MEQTTQNNSSELVILEGQIRECYGRVVYTHKTHEKCSDQRVKEHHRLKLSQIIFSAITTCGLIVVIFGNPEASKVSAILSALFSASLFALNTYTKETDYGTLAQKHKQTASKLWDVRESYLSLLTDLKMNCLSCESARNKRDALQKTLVEIYEDAPRTTYSSYRDASGGLKNKEELTFSDGEIDKFLPVELKRT